MKYLLLGFVLLTSLAHAGGHYELETTCGQVRSTGNGQILKRLEPSFFGINSKFVLKTKFENAVTFHESYTKRDTPYTPPQREARAVAYTSFSHKEKFLSLKSSLKKELKKAKKSKVPLFACVGYLNVEPLKYRGSQVYFSYESLEDALGKMRKQALRHL